MKYTVVFREGSLEDYKSGIDYYETISIELTDRFEQDFKAKLEEIEENPLHYQIRYRKIRIAFLDIFPFGIHFILEKHTIYVLKILHTKRFFK